MSPGWTEAGFVQRTVLKPIAALWPADCWAFPWVSYHIHLIEPIAKPDEQSNQARP